MLSQELQEGKEGRISRKRSPVDLQSHVLDGFGKVVLTLFKMFEVAASHVKQMREPVAKPGSLTQSGGQKYFSTGGRWMGHDSELFPPSG